MLVRYKRNYEKIAMGLLSFVPGEGDIKQLQKTIEEYENNKNWKLYLWKEEDISDFVGIIGIRQVNDELDEIQHVSVNPSHRRQGIGKTMIEAAMELSKNKMLVPNDMTQDFYENCGFAVKTD